MTEEKLVVTEFPIFGKLDVAGLRGVELMILNGSTPAIVPPFPA